LRRFLTSSNLASAGEMRRILLSTIKILIPAALLYFSLRKVNLFDLASRIRVESLGWIGLAIAAMFLQIFLGMLRWREISAECGARPHRGSALARATGGSGASRSQFR
jgi:glycosyltransferase 2 family protein